MTLETCPTGYANGHPRCKSEHARLKALYKENKIEFEKIQKQKRQQEQQNSKCFKEAKATKKEEKKNRLAQIPESACTTSIDPARFVKLTRSTDSEK